MNHQSRAFALILITLFLLSTPSHGDEADAPVGGVFVSAPGPGANSRPRVFRLSDLSELIDQLDSPSEDERWQAAYAIGRLGPDAIQASAALVEHLNDAEIRIAAARSLLKIGADHTPVLALLKDEDFSVRVEVSRALIARQIELKQMIPYALQLAADANDQSAYCDDPLTGFASFGPRGIATATPILIELLSDNNPAIGENAYLVLSSFSNLPDTAVMPLASLVTNERADIRLHAIKLLNEIGEQAKPALPELRRLLKDSIFEVRVEAAAAVARLDVDDVESIAVLTEIAAAGSSDNDVVQSAIIQLGKLGERSLPSVPVIVRHLNTSDHWMSFRAHEALANIGPKTVSVIVEAMHQAADNPGYHQLRIAGLEVIGKLGAEVKPVHAVLLEATKSQVSEEQAAGIRALAEGRFHDLETIDRLITLLESPQSEIRSAAAKALGELADANNAAATARLIGTLQDKDFTVRLAACEGLYRIKPNALEVPTALAELLRKGKPEVVVEVCDLIATMKSAAAPTSSSLVDLLESKLFVAAGFSGHPIRQSASYALASIGKPALPELIKALEHAEPQVRGLAAEALGSIGKDSGDAIPMLIKLLDDHGRWTTHCGCMGFTVEVRQAAVDALGKIGPAAAAELPQFIEFISDDALSSTAIKAIGGFGAASKSAIPDLLKIETGDDCRADLEITRALHSIDSEYPLVERLRRFLEVIEKESQEERDWSSMSEAMDLIVELGHRANPLKPMLENMILRSEFLHQDYRGEAAYALAVLEPQNPAWRAMLARMVAHDPSSLFAERLEQLDSRKK